MARNKKNNHLKDELLNGFISNTNSIGKVESEGKYKDNKRVGKWTFYDTDGSILAQGSFKDDKEHGKWIHRDSWTALEGNYKNGRKEGKWIELNLTLSNNNTSKEIYYSSDEITREIYYYPGTNQIRDDKDYVKNQTTWWYRNGQKQKEGGIKNKVLNDKWSHWYENGQLKSKGSYENGKENGLWTYWYDDGQKHSEGCYKDERRDGQWTYWYENGQKSAKGSFVSRSYHYGSRKGEGLNDQGWQKSEAWLSEKEEQKDGKWTYWHANGLKAAEGHYGGEHAMKGGNLVKEVIEGWGCFEEGDVHRGPLKTKFGNQKIGKWLYWHPNGIKAREEQWAFVHQGRRSGLTWHRRDIELEMRVGWAFSWHSNGQMSLKGYYDEEGYQIGQWIRWYPDGRRKSICHYDTDIISAVDGHNPLNQITIWDDRNRQLNVSFYNYLREGRWTIIDANGSLLSELNYLTTSDYLDLRRDGEKVNKSIFKDNKKSSDSLEIDENNFDYYWNEPPAFHKRTINQSLTDHFAEDVNFNYVEYQSLKSIFDIRDNEKRKSEMNQTSGGSSSWLDGQALTDDEKLLGESFWRGIL